MPKTQQQNSKLERGEFDAVVLAMLLGGYTYPVIARRVRVPIQQLVRYVTERGWDRPEVAWDAMRRLRQTQLENAGFVHRDGDDDAERRLQQIVGLQRSEAAALRNYYHGLLRRLRSSTQLSAQERREIFEELKIVRISAEITEILHRIDRQLYTAGPGDTEIIIDTQPQW